MQLETELLNEINYFSRESNKFGIILRNFFKTYTKKNKTPQSFTVKSLASFSFQFFSNLNVRHNPYIIELFRLEFLM